MGLHRPSPDAPDPRYGIMGARRFEYPKYVWSPTGGWWNEPKNWRRNTALAAVSAVIPFSLFLYIGTQIERRPRPPRSHTWYQHYQKWSLVDDPTLKDDPEYAQLTIPKEQDIRRKYQDTD